MVASPAEAAAPDRRVVAAVERVADGSYTPSDLALIRQHPDIARQVPDPTAPAVSTRTTGRQPSSDARAAESCGHYVNVGFTKKSLLGDTIYKWQHRVVYCRDGVNVTRWQARYDYLSKSSAVVYLRELSAHQAGTGSPAAWSHLQRHIEYCVAQVGCYANTYPWSKITVYGGGGSRYTGSAG